MHTVEYCYYVECGVAGGSAEVSGESGAALAILYGGLEREGAKIIRARCLKVAGTERRESFISIIAEWERLARAREL